MRKSRTQKLFQVINVIVMLSISIACLYPVLYVIFASLSNPAQLMNVNGFMLHPAGFSLEAYKSIFSNNIIMNGYKNTLFILAVGTSINLIMTILAAYVLSSKNVYFKPLIMIMIIITMYFQGGLIPTYLNIKRLGLYNSIWSVILPFSINTFNLIIMRTYFMTIPDSLLESAEIDGAGDITKIIRIIIPLSKPVIAVMILYYGVQHWNSWFYATMYIQDKRILPLQVILREILLLNETDSMGGDNRLNLGETIKYATIVVVMLPILIIYPLLQKYFVNGIMIGAVKG